ncbi:MAG: ATPase, T2SS/T4P/T4SS family [Candidatus Micrarchaeota archaeon]|nr:ATPase, T2SS/T4P/T4SS family [Candidatus Micrarchaeota archaeon]
MCDLRIEGTKGIVDLAKCPFEFGSPEFINYHLKNLVGIIQDTPIKEIDYEEEITFILPPEKASVLIEYAKVVSQIESIRLKKDIYGHPSDPNYRKRQALLEKFVDYIYMNPVSAARLLQEYKEPTPDSAAFMKGLQTFQGWIAGILKRFEATELLKLVKEKGDMRSAFLSLVGTKSMAFSSTISLDLPENAVAVKTAKGIYDLPFGVKISIYEIPEKDFYIYKMENPVLESLSPELKSMLMDMITGQMKENFTAMDYTILFGLKVNEYRAKFMDESLKGSIDITPKQALIMAREAASWVVGMGSPLETMMLDRDNLTDIYIDSENSPIYMDHREFGIVQSLYRYNYEMLERAFKNMIFSEKGKKFDENFPVSDVVVKREALRCHLQRPPATFGELQGALRLLSEEPFTYAQYLNYKSMSPFFAGYDDVCVSMGASGAILGVKGSGKTSFTAAEITAIGPNKRIIPIQDIWEIPVRSFRKRGFHIGAAKVSSGDVEGKETKELDLVSMANALLRMGDAALIINEIRSRSAVQGVINLLNTQPGVFLLYNLHAESLDDIRDRLELVFGIPAASMFATDRYVFLNKVKFGRRGRTNRVIGYAFESDRENKQFVKVFDYKRGNTIDNSVLNCLFLKNKEAAMPDLSKIDMKAMEKEISFELMPPLIKRKSELTGVPPEQFVLQAFFKGKVFSDLNNAAISTGLKDIVMLDFFLKANNFVNRSMASLENENGSVDFSEAQKRWEDAFPKMLKEHVEISKREKGPE